MDIKVLSHSNILWFDLGEWGNAFCSFVKAVPWGSIVISLASKPAYLWVPCSQASSSFPTQFLMALGNHPKFLPQMDAFQGSWLCQWPSAKHVPPHPLLSTLSTHCPPSFNVPHILCRFPVGSHFYQPGGEKVLEERAPTRLPGCSSCSSVPSPLYPSAVALGQAPLPHSAFPCLCKMTVW